MSWRVRLTAFVTAAAASETSYKAAQIRGIGVCSSSDGHSFSWGVCLSCGGLDPLAPPPPPTFELSVSDARTILAATKQLEPGPHVRANAIMKATATFYDVPTSSLSKTWREKKFIQPRHVAMYLVYTDTDLSYPEVGAVFGGRDHTTILYAAQKIKAELEVDVELCEHVESIRALAQAVMGASIGQ